MQIRLEAAILLLGSIREVFILRLFPVSRASPYGNAILTICTVGPASAQHLNPESFYSVVHVVMRALFYVL